MQEAKQAVHKFMNKDGKHDTNVHETIAPAVTDHHHTQHRHENVTTAIDKEVHQDHYHTTVQDVKDREVLPEKHHHNMVGVEHRKFEHGNDDEVRQRLEAERGNYTDTHTKHDTKHTSANAPTLAGEHVHHHLHENIQPVIHKEVIEPHVVHTTVPIHETHHNAAQHHEASRLPTISMAEFKQQGGVLGGRETRHDHFEGEPRGFSGHAPNRPQDESDGFRNTGHVDPHGHGLSHQHGAGTTGTGSGLTGSNTSRTTGTGPGLTGSNTAGTTGTGSGLTGSNTTGTTGVTGSRHHGVGTDGAIGSNTGRSGTTGGDLTGGTGHNRTDSTDVARDSTTTSKPSLMSRLNPFVDADGDGKKGMMD